MATEQLLNPRAELLAVWRRWMAYSGCSGEDWDMRPDRWGDSNHSQRNCIVDAELLECLLLPQFSVPGLSLEGYTTADWDVQRVLNSPENRTQGWLATESIELVVSRVDDFLNNYEIDGDDGPVADFSPRSYVRTEDATTSSEFPPVVDSFTLSLSVCLQTKYLIDRWMEAPGEVTLRKDLRVDLKDLRARADRRLTAAMEGLRRSFAVVGGGDETVWLRDTGREWPRDNPDLDSVRRRLREFGQVASGTFEIGWSWGQIPPDRRGPSPEDDRASAPSWYAEPAPYFYFTVTALDGIADLLSSKVRGSGVLNHEQTVLAARLGFFWELTWQYWMAIALASGRAEHLWAIEDVPWQSSDGVASEYYTAYVLRIMTASDAGRRGNLTSDPESLERLVRVLEELAQRARISRRPVPPQPPTRAQLADVAGRLIEAGNTDGVVGMLRQPDLYPDELAEATGKHRAKGFADPALNLHAPGLSLDLVPAEGQDAAQPGRWRVYELAPQLLKLTGALLRDAKESRARERLRNLADDTWTHLLQRSHTPQKDGGASSYGWDEAEVLRGLERKDRPLDEIRSWYITERVTEALVSMEEANTMRTGTAVTTRETVTEMFEELRWLIASEVSDEKQRRELHEGLRKARETMARSPAVALARAVRLASDLATMRNI